MFFKDSSLHAFEKPDIINKNSGALHEEEHRRRVRMWLVDTHDSCNHMGIGLTIVIENHAPVP